jgi:hypothetical protein
LFQIICLSLEIFFGFFQSSQIFLKPRVEISVYENSFPRAPSITHLIPLSFRAKAAFHQLSSHLALLLLAMHPSLLPCCCALPHAAALHRLQCCCRTRVRVKYSSADAWFKAALPRKHHCSFHSSRAYRASLHRPPFSHLLPPPHVAGARAQPHLEPSPELATLLLSMPAEQRRRISRRCLQSLRPKACHSSHLAARRRWRVPPRCFLARRAQPPPLPTSEPPPTFLSLLATRKSAHP